jgi:fermentation-respiration switch protein FrsA (DUF1100 family)
MELIREQVTRAAALLALAAGALAAGASPARAQALDVIRWPGTSNYVELRGAPDNRFVGLSRGAAATAAKFDCGRAYANLAALLRVPVATLAAADLITFEGNGGHPGESGGWESSKWFFTDGTDSLTVVYDAVAGTSIPPGVVIADASIAATDYDSYFGLTSVGEVVISYMLLDLPEEIDVTSPAFRLVVTGYPSGEGEPDPDAVGILVRGCGCAPQAAKTCTE